MNALEINMKKKGALEKYYCFFQRMKTILPNKETIDFPRYLRGIVRYLICAISFTIEKTVVHLPSNKKKMLTETNRKNDIWNFFKGRYFVEKCDANNFKEISSSFEECILITIWKRKSLEILRSKHSFVTLRIHLSIFKNNK